jgi:trehalose 6-phosphate synthase
MKATLLEAIRAPEREAARRMRGMRRAVIEHDIDAWASDFIDVLNKPPR